MSIIAQLWSIPGNRDVPFVGHDRRLVPARGRCDRPVGIRQPCDAPPTIGVPYKQNLGCLNHR
jgi:hypothetical protein